ncbi:ATP-binding protein [Nocardioides convexus]|uniref:sensor histidine kinase n=1 Tax=Nocardioides convexus TaxID=2712224 RepID=UPI002418B830|nr:ATP-binding protein [Nocardioides convexus]
MRPVERIRREVEEITGARLGRRVSEPATRDEVGRLARTMNAMLARLQDSRDRQEQFVADASHEPALAAGQHPAGRGGLPGASGGAAGRRASPRPCWRRRCGCRCSSSSLLVLTRAGEGRDRAPRAEVDLDDLALTAVRRVVRPGLDMDTTAVGAARLHGDPVALGQVVRNLVDNGARHARTRLAVAVAQEPGSVLLSVEDDGPGIAPADRTRVFERFVRLDEARARDAGGSGLGLAIVREVVNGHGGSVAVEDGVLGGARFVVRLPG